MERRCGGRAWKQWNRLFSESNINWIRITTRGKQWSVRFSINFRNKVYRICEWIDMRWNGRKELEMRLKFWLEKQLNSNTMSWPVQDLRRDVIKHSNLVLIMIHDYKASTWRSEVVVVVQLLSCLQFFVTLWAAAHQASLSFTISQKWT